MMRQRIFLSIAATLALAISLGTAARADLASGAEVQATLQDALDTKTSHVGDPVILKVVSVTAPGDSTGLDGATIKAHVAQAVPSSPTKKAMLRLTFETITLSDGRSFLFPAEVQSMSQHKRMNYGQAASEVVVGMLVGNFLGKKMGVPTGGTVGFGGGALYASNMAQDFRVPEKSTVMIKTTEVVPMTPHPQAR